MISEFIMVLCFGVAIFFIILGFYNDNIIGSIGGILITIFFVLLFSHYNFSNEELVEAGVAYYEMNPTNGTTKLVLIDVDKIKQ